MQELIDAIKLGDLEKIKTLLQNDQLLVLGSDGLGLTPLMWAVYSGYYDISNYLIEKGADVNAQSQEIGSSVIHFAVENGNLAIVELLIENGADIFACDPFSKMSALHYAVNGKADSQIIEKLVNLGLDLDGKDEFERTILDRAVDLWDLEKIATICQMKKIDFDCFINARKLSTVFNNHEIATILDQNKHSAYTSGYLHGGTHHEALAIIIETLKKFLACVEKQEYLDNELIDESIDLVKFTYDLDKVKTIIERLESLRKRYSNVNMCTGQHRQLPTKLTEPYYFVTGFAAHDIYGVVHHSNSNYNFSLYDRGLFAKKVGNTDNTYSEFNVKVAKQEIFEKLHNIFGEIIQENKDAAAKFFKEGIPSLVSNSNLSVNEKITQKAFKRGRCYFENLKSLLLAEFSHSYGYKEGKFLYKFFDLLMHIMIAEDFFLQNMQNEALEDNCNKLIQKKIEKLETLIITRQEATSKFCNNF